MIMSFTFQFIVSALLIFMKGKYILQSIQNMQSNVILRYMFNRKITITCIHRQYRTVIPMHITFS